MTWPTVTFWLGLFAGVIILIRMSDRKQKQNEERDERRAQWQARKREMGNGDTARKEPQIKF